VRRICVQACQEFIVNHPELLRDIAGRFGFDLFIFIIVDWLFVLFVFLLCYWWLTYFYFLEPLKQRQHDPDESVRMDVVQAVIAAAKREFNNITPELFDCVKERILDKKVAFVFFWRKKNIIHNNSDKPELGDFFSLCIILRKNLVNHCIKFIVLLLFSFFYLASVNVLCCSTRSVKKLWWGLDWFINVLWWRKNQANLRRILYPGSETKYFMLTIELH